MRITTLKMMARDRDPAAQETLQSVLDDAAEDESVRIGAAHALCLLDKREVYQLILKTLAHTNREIRNETIANLYMLHDSRLLFPLINLYNQMDDQVLHDWSAKLDIIRTIGYTGDPRAVDFLDCIENRLHPEADEAKGLCLGNHRFIYTYHGNEEERKQAAAQTAYRGVVLNGKDVLRRKDVATFLQAEQQGGLMMALYVVLPDDPADPFASCSATIAPRRSEHFMAAKGRDVLAAGEIGFDAAGDVRYVSNQSAGFMPGSSSIHWVHAALAKTDVKPPQAFTETWPAVGYCSEDFLRIHPFSRNAS